MTISSNCKRLMAFTMAIALVLSVLFVPKAPSASAAVEDQPSVSVLGATIRLSTKVDSETGEQIDNNGKQSMMIGVQINNANKASACAIHLTSNGGSSYYTITTDNTLIPYRTAGKGSEQKTLHSKDPANNNIVYAIVIYNIPPAHYYNPIGIVGEVFGIDQTTRKTTSTVNKNVGGVVSAIAAQFPDKHISIKESDGCIYKDNEGSKLLTSDLTIDPSDPGSGNYSEDPNPEPVNDIETPLFTNEDAFEDGAKYMLLYNCVGSGSAEEYYTNVGNLYALTNNLTNARGKQLNTELEGDRSVIYNIDYYDVINSNSLWLCESYNNSNTEFTLKNVSTGQYLDYGNGTISISNSTPTSTSGAWKLGNYVGDNNDNSKGYHFVGLTPVAGQSSSKFVRVSNGSNKFTYGSYNKNGDASYVGSDYKNGSVYLYKLNFCKIEFDRDNMGIYEKVNSLADTHAGLDVVFVADDGDKKYAMSSDGTEITKTDVTDYVIDDYLYVLNDDYEAITWDCLKQNSGTKGFSFQNIYSKQYFGIYNNEFIVNNTIANHTESGDRAYTDNYIWNGSLQSQKNNSFYLNYSDGFNKGGSSNISIYVRKYDGIFKSKKTIWRRVTELTPNRDYLIVDRETGNDAKVLKMNGSSCTTQSVNINGDGSITYAGAYNDAAVFRSYGLEGGKVMLNGWSNSSSRQTLCINNSKNVAITSDLVSKDKYFRFEYENGTSLKAYYYANDSETTYLRYNNGFVGNGSGTDVYIFEREL